MSNELWIYPTAHVYCNKLHDTNGGFFLCDRIDGTSKYETCIMFPAQDIDDPPTEYVLELYANGIATGITTSVFVGGDPDEIFYSVASMVVDREVFPNEGGRVNVTIFMDMT